MKKGTEPGGSVKKEPPGDVLEAVRAGWGTTVRYGLLLLAGRPATTAATTGLVVVGAYLRARGLIP